LAAGCAARAGEPGRRREIVVQHRDAGRHTGSHRVRQVKIRRAGWNEDLFRALEGFPDLAHDDEVDACSGALEMLHPESAAWAFYELCRRQAERFQQKKSSWVRLQVPRGIGAVQTFSGRHLNVGEDRTLDMSAEDAEYLIRDGWTKLAEWESVEDA
jgi:hypothetical protein